MERINSTPSTSGVLDHRVQSQFAGVYQNELIPQITKFNDQLRRLPLEHPLSSFIGNSKSSAIVIADKELQPYGDGGWAMVSRFAGEATGRVYAEGEDVKGEGDLPHFYGHSFPLEVVGSTAKYLTKNEAARFGAKILASYSHALSSAMTILQRTHYQAYLDAMLSLNTDTLPSIIVQLDPRSVDHMNALKFFLDNGTAPTSSVADFKSTPFKIFESDGATEFKGHRQPIKPAAGATYHTLIIPKEVSHRIMDNGSEWYDMYNTVGERGEGNQIFKYDVTKIPHRFNLISVNEAILKEVPTIGRARRLVDASTTKLQITGMRVEEVGLRQVDANGKLTGEAGFDRTTRVFSGAVLGAESLMIYPFAKASVKVDEEKTIIGGSPTQVIISAHTGIQKIRYTAATTDYIRALAGYDVGLVKLNFVMQ